MNDDDFKAAFRGLDQVEPSADFWRRVRSIPQAHPREAALGTSVWHLFGARSRLFALALSATCGLFVGYVTLEQETADDELTAFMELETEDTLWAGVMELAGDAP